MLSWFHFSSRPFPVSSKHLTRVTRPRLHTALTHGNPVSRISRSRFTRAASGRTSKTSWFGCSHPLTAVLWKPVLIFYSFRSLPFPVLYSLCKFQIFVKGFLARNHDKRMNVFFFYKFISSSRYFSGFVPIAYLFFFILNGRRPTSAIFKIFSASFLIIFRL